MGCGAGADLTLNFATQIFLGDVTALCDVGNISLAPPPSYKILESAPLKGGEVALLGFQMGKYSRLSCNGSFTPKNLLPTVRSDCKKLGAAPIASDDLKPVTSDSREQIYLKVILCE